MTTLHYALCAALIAAGAPFLVTATVAWWRTYIEKGNA